MAGRNGWSSSWASLPCSTARWWHTRWPRQATVTHRTRLGRRTAEDHRHWLFGIEYAAGDGERHAIGFSTRQVEDPLCRAQPIGPAGSRGELEDASTVTRTGMFRVMERVDGAYYLALIVHQVAMQCDGIAQRRAPSKYTRFITSGTSGPPSG